MVDLATPLADTVVSPPMGNELTRSHRRVTICFHDDTICQRSQDKLLQLLSSATSTAINTTSTNARLARKALQYRKVWSRMTNIDIASPLFDASEFMGVNWCHTKPRVEDHCKRTALSYPSV